MLIDDLILAILAVGPPARQPRTPRPTLAITTSGA
jgi:hypothetical protein